MYQFITVSILSSILSYRHPAPFSSNANKEQSPTLVDQSQTPAAHNLKYQQTELFPPSIASQHIIHQLTQGPPVVLAAGKGVLVDEEDVVLEARVEVWLEPELQDDGVVMAVDVCVDAVQPLENLSDEGGKSFGEWNAW